MYVTLEPCQMCSGAIVQARMKQGGSRMYESKGGMCRFYPESAADGRSSIIRQNLTTGVLEEECSQMMKQFFRELRQKQKLSKQQRS